MGVVSPKGGKVSKISRALRAIIIFSTPLLQGSESAPGEGGKMVTS